MRSVDRIVDSIRTLEGGGFSVRRPFPTRTLDHFDPFLLLDEMGPVQLGPGEAKGAPDHPHRGFETVSYILDGRMEHKDSAGNAGQLGPGDVQWMTAGGGVIHAEMPEAEFRKTGGRMHGFQIWVNLPARDKLMKPRYQEVPSARVPVGTSEDGKVSVRVIAGEALGQKAVIDTRTPIQYLHFSLAQGGRVTQPVPSGWNALLYIFGGALQVGSRQAKDGHLVLLEKDGDSIEFSALLPSEVLLLAGQPLDEPVARYGPFVMNTPDEIEQAVRDYRSGRMGRIA
jgi:redox-sensitive bicupin YhaK (pirin superfamily)